MVALASTVRAQRLTASEVWALITKSLILMGGLCSTPYGIRGLGTVVERTERGENIMCSTPYGIRGLGTVNKGKRFPHALLKVLNALRHQRFGH